MLGALKAIGGGSLYEVHLVWDELLHTLCVAKVVRPDRVDDRRALRELREEAEILDRLSHPVIVRKFDAIDEGAQLHGQDGCRAPRREARGRPRVANRVSTDHLNGRPRRERPWPFAFACGGRNRTVGALRETEGVNEDSLPPAISHYLDRALRKGPKGPRLVRITQRGEMWRKPGGRALRFEAVQEYEVRRVGFSWRARFVIAPLLSLEVTNGYERGEGRLEAKLWGSIPVMLARGSHLGRGEAMRYLSELPWVPHAMAANPELEWRELATGAVEVATGVGPARVDIRFDFDEEGDIYRASSDVRPRLVGRTSIPTPWSGEFWDYKTIGGVRLPTQAEVSWRLPEAEGEFTYWRGAVTSLRAA